ncbi:hypothetical protein QQF64_034545 [Cirrhinus molitorella]|uniref:Secreted protein n=1 Tax=Cirrhinus molitorella TaxID=172907 RepID=A0ABR3L4H9_9TELE
MFCCFLTLSGATDDKEKRDKVSTVSLHPHTFHSSLPSLLLQRTRSPELCPLTYPPSLAGSDVIKQHNNNSHRC